MMDISAYNAGAAASCRMVGILNAQTAFGMAATAVATTCGIAAVGATRVGWRAGRSCGLVTGLETNALEVDSSIAASAALLKYVIFGFFCCAKLCKAESTSVVVPRLIYMQHEVG